MEIMQNQSGIVFKTLDDGVKENFKKTIVLECVEIPKRVCREYIHCFKKENWLGDLNDTYKFRQILDGESESTKILLFSPEKKDRVREFIEGRKEDFVIKEYRLEIGYENYSFQKAMDKLLPKGLDRITSFEQVGHIAHLNLLPSHLPYKYQIGQVILDKLKVRTVVNKLGMIDSVYREFKMEVLAGDADFCVETKEHGIRYRFDYSKVYWNSRLSNEHQRILKHFKKGEVICDMMCGVGPFALPAAKKGFTVLANDLNPNSYQSLVENAKLNKLDKYIQSFNLDGREFIKKLVESDTHFDHVIMNLPASAVEFLDVFLHRFPQTWKKLPMIHVYTFACIDDGNERGEHIGIQNVKSEIFKVLKSKDIIFDEIFDVRDVSPKKHMFCASFVLPLMIGSDQTISGKKRTNDQSMQPTKKPRNDS